MADEGPCEQLLLWTCWWWHACCAAAMDINVNSKLRREALLLPMQLDLCGSQASQRLILWLNQHHDMIKRTSMQTHQKFSKRQQLLF